MTASPFKFRSALVTISTCRSLLGKGEDFVLGEIENGGLRFAFNLARRGARRIEARILVLSLLDLINGTNSQPAKVEDVIAYAVPGVLKDGATRSSTLCRSWVTSPTHILGLVSDGLLSLAKPPENRTAARWISVASARAFLKSRRLV